MSIKHLQNKQLRQVQHRPQVLHHPVLFLGIAQGLDEVFSQSAASRDTLLPQD